MQYELTMMLQNPRSTTSTCCGLLGQVASYDNLAHPRGFWIWSFDLLTVCCAACKQIDNKSTQVEVGHERHLC